MLERSALDLRYVKLPVEAVVDGVAIDPTADVVAMAFPLPGVDPQTGDWKAGSWETIAGIRPRYNLRCLVGPGGTIALSRGTYDIWARVTDSPEVVVQKVGAIRIT
jgi:hypothetical protein